MSFAGCGQLDHGLIRKEAQTLKGRRRTVPPSSAATTGMTPTIAPPVSTNSEQCKHTNRLLYQTIEVHTVPPLGMRPTPKY